jgi:hypothetical protein
MPNVRTATLGALGLAALSLAVGAGAQTKKPGPAEESTAPAATTKPTASGKSLPSQPASPGAAAKPAGKPPAELPAASAAGAKPAPTGKPSPVPPAVPAVATKPAPAGKPPPPGKPAPAAKPPAPPPVAPPPVAGWSALDDAQASTAANSVTAWIAASHDNGALPYLVIDKKAAAVLVYDPKGKLQGASPVLIGVASGDDSSPGVGSKNLAEIGPAEKTTPAGRFVAKYGEAAGGQRDLWVDWATSVALHPVVTGNKRERRLERLLSPSPVDNRITFGCINVPTAFYKDKVYPLFRKAGGVVYILPDTKPLERVFPRVLIRPPATQAVQSREAVAPPHV